jgi:hypothetical protein
MTTYRPWGTGEPVEIVATIADLHELIARGDFHHATYRDHGKAHEGLCIYARDPNGFRGYRYMGRFCSDKPEVLREAEQIVASYGTSVGSYGNG